MTLYKDLKKFSQSIGINETKLVEAFELERDFHESILKEDDPVKRKKMYYDIYNLVHSIYGPENSESNLIEKQWLIHQFKKELKGKSVLDIGCGNGLFLNCILKSIEHGKLVGIDVSKEILPVNCNGIKFICSDIVNYNTQEKFDVVFSNNVFEHIAPADIPAHIISIRRSLVDTGMLILIMPNRLCGPTDVSRIIDNSRTNKLSALGTHLNESTYGEVINILKNYGFKRFKTISPIPKLKSLFPSIRINPNFLISLEKYKILLNILYSIKKNNISIAYRFLSIILICKLY